MSAGRNITTRAKSRKRRQRKGVVGFISENNLNLDYFKTCEKKVKDSLSAKILLVHLVPSPKLTNE